MSILNKIEKLNKFLHFKKSIFIFIKPRDKIFHVGLIKHISETSKKELHILNSNFTITSCVKCPRIGVGLFYVYSGNKYTRLLFT